MNKNLVYVLIVTNAGRKNLLYECLSSLKNTDYRDFEIVVVDNNSNDGTVEMVETTFPEVKIIENKENLGPSLARNIGLKFILEHTDAQYICLLDSDTVVGRNWLSTLIKAISSEEKIGLCGPEFTDDKTEVRGESNLEIAKTDALMGACILIKRGVFDKIGLLNPDYFIYCEETDFEMRAVSAGYSIVKVMNCIIYHHSGIYSRKGGAKSSYLQLRNTMMLYMINTRKFPVVLRIIYILYELFVISVLLNIIPTRNRWFLKNEEIVKKRYIPSMNPIPNFIIYISALIWHLWHIQETLNARKYFYTIIEQSGKRLPWFNKIFFERNDYIDEFQKKLLLFVDRMI